MKKFSLITIGFIAIIAISGINLTINEKSVSVDKPLGSFIKIAKAGVECTEYDFDNMILDQVTCWCSGGGSGEKMDCVNMTNKCCDSRTQTTCDCD